MPKLRPVTINPAAPASDDTVQLSPFAVKGESTNGYIASESTTGTRVATKIADLPFVVNVVTSQFLNDFDFFDLGQNLGYTSSLSAVDSEGNFNLRGFTSINSKWNGFYELGVLDRVTLDRIEIIKGPNAAIYGETSPAGQVNYISKQPTNNPYETVTATYGSNGLARVEGNLNNDLGSIAGIKFYNLVSFQGTDSKPYVHPDYAYLHSRTFADALKMKFNDHSSLLLNIEWNERLSNTGDTVQPFLIVPGTEGKSVQYTGQLAPLALARFSQGGPLESQAREMTKFYSVYENQFNDVFSLKVSSYYYDRHNNEIYNGQSMEYDPLFADPNGDRGAITDVSTSQARTFLNEDGGATTADLLAHYFLFHHSVDNKTLLTMDYSQNWRYRHETELPSKAVIPGSVSQANFPTFFDPNNPVYTGVGTPGLPTGVVGIQNLYTIVTRNDKTRWDTEGAFLHDQATLLDGRLLVFAGMRHDQVTFNLDYGNQFSTSKISTTPSTPGQVQHFVNSAWTPAAGANFKLTHNIALYGNYSQSFEPSAQSAKLGDPPLPNTRGSGVDYGIKCNFFNQRLNFTLGGYYVTETGIKISVLQPDGTTLDEAAGSETSKGLESDATFQVTDAFDVNFGYGYCNARLLNQGTDSIADGLRPPNIPVDNGYVDLSYSFLNSRLKGLSAHAGVTYDGVSYPETTAKTSPEAHIQLPSYYAAEVGVGYSWTQNIHGTKFVHTIKGSVDNALNRDYVTVKGSPVNPRAFYIAYVLSH